MNAQNKSRLFQLIGIAVIAVVSFMFHSWYSNRHPSTDDAYIHANIVNVAPRVSGYVSSVAVEDHQVVTAGQVLFKLDPKPFEAVLAAQQAQLTLAEVNLKRARELMEKKLNAQSDLDAAESNYQVSKANVELAKLNLEYTTVTAPAAGEVTNLSLRIGNFVSVGDSQFAIVESGPKSWWVEANFKETHLGKIQPGQSATVVLDMYPKHLFKGEVNSISPATGAVFSLLPPENATGNWIKVVQRVPVRIYIEDNKDFRLRVGASAEVTVDASKKP